MAWLARDRLALEQEEGKADMPRYLWGPDGRRWEIAYHQAYSMWEIVDFEACPFSLRYSEMSGYETASCRICGGEADPAVFLRNPETGTALRDTGPICLDCVCGKPSWHTLVPISIPRSLIGETPTASIRLHASRRHEPTRA
jgi:hypothetical protein